MPFDTRSLPHLHSDYVTVLTWNPKAQRVLSFCWLVRDLMHFPWLISDPYVRSAFPSMEPNLVFKMVIPMLYHVTLYHFVQNPTRASYHAPSITSYISVSALRQHGHSSHPLSLPLSLSFSSPPLHSNSLSSQLSMINPPLNIPLPKPYYYTLPFPSHRPSS